MRILKLIIGSTIWLGFLAAVPCHAALAAQRSPTMTQFVHRAWTQRDGVPRGILAMAQTTDGYLWLGASDGLFRFDGVIFERYEPESGTHLPTGNVQSLLALPNGDLWVGYHSGAISRVRDGRVDTWPGSTGATSGNVWCFAQDRDGTLWAGGTGGLRRFAQNRWEDIGSEWHLPGKSVRALLVDHNGTLWASTEDTIIFLPKGTRTFQPTSIPVATVYSIVESPQGKLWMAETERAVRPIPLGNMAEPSDKSQIDVASVRILFDADGSFWVTSVGDGLRHLSTAEYLRDNSGLRHPITAFESFTAADGLTRDVISTILQDRDGNIWIGTPSGLDRFQKKFFQTVQMPQKNGDILLAAGADGDVWGFMRGWMWHIAGSRIVQQTDGIDPGQVSFGFHDAKGTLWAVSPKNVTRIENGRWSMFPLPKELADPNWRGGVYIAQDRSGVLWLAAEMEGLFRWDNGVWRRFDTPRELMKALPMATYTDESGRVWFAYSSGTVICLENGRLQTIASSQSFSGTDAYSLDGHAGTIWIGEGTGLAFFDGHTLHTVIPEDKPSFGRVLGVKQAIDGSVWLYGFDGITRIGPEEIRKLLAAPSYRPHYEVFDPPHPILAVYGQKLIAGTDGRLWFGSDGYVDSVNPKDVPKQASFPVAIRSFSADGAQYPSRNNPTLPARPRRIEIDYAGLNLSNPERVRYRYKLDGIDGEWQEAGVHREAFYTDLAPGKHRFEVEARNEGGEWETTGAILEFRIAPAWFETISFRVLCLGLFSLFLWGLYQLRLKQLKREFNVALQTRVDERTRIARELHDTMLQSFQGLLLRFQTVANLLPSRPEDAKTRIDKVIEEGSNAITEGRDAVHELRSAGLMDSDLAESIRNFVRELLGNLTSGNLPEFHVQLEGTPKELNPVVRDEAYRIAAEALRNAIRHAGAKRIEVEMRYDQEYLTLRIRDDGKGIDAGVLDKQHAPGHWGLRGMRERAKLIGSTLEIWSEPGSGTEIELKIPAPTAYAKLFARRRSFFHSAQDKQHHINRRD